MNLPLNYMFYIIFLLFIIIFLYFRNITKIDFFTIKSNKLIKCNKQGCPISKENKIYKLHLDYKPIRDKNHMLSHHDSNGLSTLFTFNTQKGPSNIFIIRHGEKIKSREALDCNGILRSTYIPNLIENINAKGYGIHAIITSNDYNSMHQHQTVSFTSWLMSIPIFIYGETNETIKVTEQLFTNSYFKDKNVLICWEHNCIQSLIKNIIEYGPKAKGLTNYVYENVDGGDDVPAWDTDNYQSVIHFDSNLKQTNFVENINTCFLQDNANFIDGLQQHCK